MLVEAKHQEAESMLTTNLVRRQQELQATVNATDVEAKRDQLFQRNEDLKSAQLMLQNVMQSQRDIATKLESSATRVNDCEIMSC